jgi:hypothetical protein
MQSIEAKEIDLSNFNPVMAGYGPKNIHAVAALVTEDNIGQMALEFELDVQYLDETFVRPYFKFLADRTADEPIELTVQPEFWIVLLWEEIHIFKDGLFQKTFEIEISPAGKKVVEYAAADAVLASKIWDGLEDKVEVIDETPVEATQIVPVYGKIAYENHTARPDLLHGEQGLPRHDRLDPLREYRKKPMMSGPPIGGYQAIEDEKGIYGKPSPSPRELPENPHNTEGVDTPALDQGNRQYPDGSWEDAEEFEAFTNQKREDDPNNR